MEKMNMPLDIPDDVRPEQPERPGTRAARRARAEAAPRRARVETGEPAARRAKTEAAMSRRARSAATRERTGARSVARSRKRKRRNGDLPLWVQKLGDRCLDLGAWLMRLPGRVASRVRRSWFYRIYFGAVALALIGIAVGVHWLNGFAADYEASQPVHVADEVARLFIDGDYDRIYDLDSAAQALSGGDRAFYVESLGNLAAGKAVDCQSAFSADKAQLRYNVTLDGAKFAEFTLIPSGSTTSHGNTLWRLGSVTTNVALEAQAPAPKDPNLAPYRIQALPEYTVTVDGQALGTESVLRTGVALLPEGFLPSGVAAPTLTEYGFYSEAAEPVITVTAPDGSALTPREDSENIWVCGPREDEALKAQYGEAIVKMAQRIAKYTTQDISQSKALEAVQGGSPAEDIIKKFSNRWAPSHKEESFENMEVSDLYTVSGDCITCHVKFDYILTSHRKNDYTYPTEYTFCIVRSDGEGKLYNLLFH